MTEEHETGCDKKGELGNNEEMEDEEIDRLWQRMQKRNRVTTALKQPKDDSQGIEKIVLKGGSRTNDDPDGDDDELDEIWGDRFGSKLLDSDDGEDATNRSRKTKSGAKRGKTATTTRAAGETPQKVRIKIEPPSDSKPGSTKKELDKSEQVLLEVRQFKDNIADDAQVPKLSQVKVLGLMTKLEARLTSDLIKIYTSDYSGGAAVSRGMNILEQLQTAQRDMQLLKYLIVCYKPASDKEKKKASEFGEALAAVRQVEVKVGSLFDEELFRMSFNEAAEDSRWDACKACIMETDNAMIMKLDTSRRSEVANSLLVEVVVSFCRVAEEAKFDDTHNKFLKYVKMMEPEVSKMRLACADDWSRLLLVLAVNEDTSEDDMLIADRARTELNNNRSGIFFKALAILPMGRIVMRRMANVSDQLARDKQMKQEIIALQKVPRSLPEGDLIAAGFLMVPRADRWSDCYVKLSNILANASVNFQGSHRCVLAQFDADQKQLMDLLIQKAEAHLVSKLWNVAHMAHQLCNGNGGPVDTAAAVKQVTEEAASVSAKTLWSKVDLAKLFNPDRCKHIAHVIKVLDDRVASFVAVWPVLLAGVTGAPTNIHDDLFKQLCKKHSQLDNFWTSLGEMGTSMQTTIVQIVSAKVKEMLNRDVESFVDFTLKLNDLDGDAEPKDLMKTLSTVELCGEYDNTEEIAVVFGQLQKDQQVICDEFLPYLPQSLALTLKDKSMGWLKVAMAPLLLRLARLAAAVDKFDADENKCIP